MLYCDFTFKYHTLLRSRLGAQQHSFHESTEHYRLQLPANGYDQQKEKRKAFLPLFYSQKATWCWPHNSWWAGELHNHQLNCSSWLHYIPWRWWAKVYSASLTLSAHSPNPLIQTILHPIPFHCSHCSNVHNTIVQGEQLSFWAAGKYKITGMIATRQRKQVTKPELKLKIVTDWQRKQLDSNTRNQQEAAWQG